MTNRVAFVTGGAQGIGQGISETLGANGFRVAVADLNLEAAEATAKRIAESGGEAIAVHVDVTDTNSVRGAVKTVTDELGDIEIVVNNAGWDDFMPFLKTSEDFWDKILDINFKGALRVSHIVVPGMVERGFGRVINIGSIEGIRTSHLEAYSYAASKAGVNHLTRIMAKFLAPKHIAVNAIAPGYFPSKMTDAIDDHGAQEVIDDAPMKRMGHPDDLAGIAIYLASRASGFVCGAVIPVDGGLATTA